MNEDTLRPVLRPCGLCRKRWADPAAGEENWAEHVTMPGRKLRASVASTYVRPAKRLFYTMPIPKHSKCNASLNA